MAASGGYWLATAAPTIYVSQSSLVGSIGVISQGFGFHETIAKLGKYQNSLTVCACSSHGFPNSKSRIPNLHDFFDQSELISACLIWLIASTCENKKFVIGNSWNWYVIAAQRTSIAHVAADAYKVHNWIHVRDIYFFQTSYWCNIIMHLKIKTYSYLFRHWTPNSNCWWKQGLEWSFQSSKWRGQSH